MPGYRLRRTYQNPAEKDYRKRYAVLIRIVDPANTASAPAEKAVAAKELARLRATYSQEDLEARVVVDAFFDAWGQRSEKQKREDDEDESVKDARHAKSRGQRLRHLASNVEAAMDALGTRTTARLVSAFLSSLARVECYAPYEIKEVPGLSHLLASAVAARKEHAAELGRLAGELFDFEYHLEQGLRFAYDPDDPAGPDDIPDCINWLANVVEIATLTAWMPAKRRRQALQLVKEATALIQDAPESFLSESAFATDRLLLEGSDGLCPAAGDFLEMLSTLPLRVMANRARAGSVAGKRKIGKAPTRLT